LTSGAFCGIIVIEGKVGIIMDKNFYGENVFFDHGNMGDPNESKKFLEGLAKNERLLKNQEQIIEDAQELKRLLTLNYRTKIISYKTIYDISRPMIKKAQEELNEKDGRKKKDNLHWLEKQIRDDFVPTWSGIKITEFATYGVGSVSDIVYFTNLDNGGEYFLYIPNKANMTASDLYWDDLYGKFCFGKRTNSVHMNVFEFGYTINEVRDGVFNYQQDHVLEEYVSNK
jgi:hypothetical protein